MTSGLLNQVPALRQIDKLEPDRTALPTEANRPASNGLRRQCSAISPVTGLSNFCAVSPTVWNTRTGRQGGRSRPISHAESHWSQLALYPPTDCHTTIDLGVGWVSGGFGLRISARGLADPHCASADRALRLKKSNRSRRLDSGFQDWGVAPGSIRGLQTHIHKKRELKLAIKKVGWFRGLARRIPAPRSGLWPDCSLR
jgi:hypothetical protein